MIKREISDGKSNYNLLEVVGEELIESKSDTDYGGINYLFIVSFS